jgi:reversibly glycosylated polypeptide/UDP-arabinopyranose mutase
MDSPKNVVIVVPTIRENSIKDFLTAWEREFKKATLVIVEDNAERTFDIKGGKNVEHYCHQDIDRDLGKDAWIIPRKTDCVRSYGYFKAWQKKPDMMITLDDDCYPNEGQKDFIATHWARLQNPGATSAWVSTLDGIIPRGVPYEPQNLERRRPCVLNHGLWNNVPDFDAPTQMLHMRNPRDFVWTDRTIPVGSYFPMCGMNVAIRRDAIPAFYFLLMNLKTYGFDRFGDIWAGVIIKKIADHLGWSINSGSPAIKHLRASNVWANLRKEAPGLGINETFWAAVDAVPLRGSSFRECYREIAEGIKIESAELPEYFPTLKKAMMTWTDLFTE